MNRTLPDVEKENITVQQSTPTPTTSEMVWEVTELAGGAAVMFLPLLLLAVPGILLFAVLPGLVLLAPVVVAGAILGPVYLLIRLVRRLLRRRAWPV